MPLDLQRWQADFAAALADADAAAAFAPQLDGAQALAVARLALYRGNLNAAWEKALANSYPVTRALVGDEFFAGLARAYAHVHPSTSGDLNRFGARLAAFVAAFEHTQSLPYLSDVAALEWAVHRAHYAADAPTLARERIAILSPQQLLAARFVLHPACAWMASEYPIASIWLAHQPHTGVALPASIQSAECALVVRPQWRVEVVLASVAELAALTRLRDGGGIDAAIATALELDATFDFAGMLVRWLDLGVIVDLHT